MAGANPETVAAVVTALEDALGRLHAGTDAVGAGRDETLPVAAVRDGRYEGGNGVLYVELRVDAGGSGVLSGDVHDTRMPGSPYVASFRTAPRTRYDGGAAVWPAIWQDSLGATATGSVRLAAAEGRATATLRTDAPLNVLPPHTDIQVIVDRAGDALRRIGLEIETEKGIIQPDPVPFGGTAITIREAFTRAGFAVQDAGATTVIPTNAGGWGLDETYSVLNDLMADTAQASVAAASWDLHLLMLGKSAEPRLNGVMFDGSGPLPRQGVALFVDAIRNNYPPAEHNRKIIQVAVHELGHALNLAHRFEREVGHADSTSFMNYDWRYLGGNHAAEFWQQFAWTFDADELEFLRHAPRAALMPGGDPFHSVNYWSNSSGSYSPYAPEQPIPGLSLTLTPPAAGAVFACGQPVFLEIIARNETGQTITLPDLVLDPKAGFLELLVRRVTGTTTPALAEATRFVPMVQRCFDVTPQAADLLPHGSELHNNINLTFGSGGFAFAEPGAYGITPLISYYTGSGSTLRNRVARGPELQIRVANPHDPADEQDAMTLLRPDVGAWFALGGNAVLRQAGDDLEELRASRAARLGDDDGVVTAIVRAAGIDAGRDILRYKAGRFRRTASDRDRAAKLLGSLDAPALRTFDAHTAAGTRRLAAAYAGK